MAKAAALKKIEPVKSSKKTAAKTAPVKKTQLKVVTPSPVKPAAKKPAAKAKAAPVKAAPVKIAKPLAKAPLKTVAQPAKPVAKAPAPVKPAAKAAPVKSKEGFSIGDHVVYPTHGVGRITAQETQEIGEVSLRMLVISFEKDRMTLRVPVHRAGAAGLRHISGDGDMQKMFLTLKGKARTSRGMWSRRAQEYETKINSGNVLSIAEVVRDLHHNVDQAERSYSERMIYESALNRLVGELAASENMDHKNAADKLLKLLRGRVAA